MLTKAIWILLLITLAQFVILWSLTHLGIVIVGACSWWLWSKGSERHDA